MFPNSQTGPAWQRKQMFDAHAAIMEATSALDFLSEILLPKDCDEKLELSVRELDGLACNLKIISRSICDKLEHIPDTESGFKRLIESTGGKNHE